MSGAIFLIDAAEQLVQLREQAYDSEDLLQRLLATHPDLLAGEQMDRDEPRRWLLVQREAGVPGESGGGNRWSVDHLFLDQDGIPTLVEVKRSTDTRLRREVVGQLLDYAANAAVHWPAGHLRSTFESRCQASGTDPEDALREFLGPEADPEQFWDRVSTNLAAGKLRLLFVADEIPPELRTIVEFLNRQMSPAEVLAVEIRQFTGQGLRTLVPTVHGQIPKPSARAQETRSRPRWDEPSFFERLAEERPQAEVEVARAILEWARPNSARVWWGRGTRAGSFIPVVHHDGTDYQLFALWSSGSVEIYFYWYAYKGVFQSPPKRREMLDLLNSIPGVSLGADAIDRRPNIPLAALTDPAALRQFLDVFEWFLAQVAGPVPDPSS